MARCFAIVMFSLFQWPYLSQIYSSNPFGNPEWDDFRQSNTSLGSQKDFMTSFRQVGGDSEQTYGAYRFYMHDEYKGGEGGGVQYRHPGYFVEEESASYITHEKESSQSSRVKIFLGRNILGAFVLLSILVAIATVIILAIFCKYFITVPKFIK